MSEPWIRLTPLVPRTPRLPWRPLLVTVVLVGVAAVLAAVVWSRLAEPPEWVVSQGEGYRGTVESTQQFGVIAWFVACCGVPGLLLGAGLGWRYHRLGWPFVLLLSVLASLAAVLTWRLGVLLGPADPTGRFADLADGTRVPAALVLDTPGALLVWPVAVLLGLVLVVTLAVPEEEEPLAREWDDDSAAPEVGQDPPRLASGDPRNL
ncbi:MAG: hypothetical protein Q7T56_10885 [Nocardioidaceae bacterium]|nr:hypothetical protein [Nocardioidaceae bacterium]